MLRRAGAICGILLLGITVHARQENKPKATKDAVKAAPKTKKTASKAPKTTPQEASTAEKPAVQSGIVVAVDPTTRQIRQPTPDEIRALGQRGPNPQLPAPAREIRGPGGAVGIELGPESQVYTVVTRTPDGQVHMEEVTGDKAAKDRVAPGSTPKSGDEK